MRSAGSTVDGSPADSRAPSSKRLGCAIYTDLSSAAAVCRCRLATATLNDLPRLDPDATSRAWAFSACPGGRQRVPVGSALVKRGEASPFGERLRPGALRHCRSVGRSVLGRSVARAALVALALLGLGSACENEEAQPPRTPTTIGSVSPTTSAPPTTNLELVDAERVWCSNFENLPRVLAAARVLNLKPVKVIFPPGAKAPAGHPVSANADAFVSAVREANKTTDTWPRINLPARTGAAARLIRAVWGSQRNAPVVAYYSLSDLPRACRAAYEARPASAPPASVVSTTRAPG